MEAAHQATQTSLKNLGTETGSLYQQALAQSQSDTDQAAAKHNSMSTGLMTSLQSERAARGTSMTSSAEAGLAYNQGKQGELLSAVGELNKGSLTRQGAAAQDSMKGMQGSEMFLDTTHKSEAKGLAQSELMGLYNTYLERKMALEGERTVTEKERGDYIVQTEMTLKEQARQRAAAKAAAAASAAIAAGNLGYKYEALNVNTQYKYDSLAARTAQNDIQNQLKRAGLSASMADKIYKRSRDDAKFQLALDKFGFDKQKWQALQGKGGKSVNDLISELIASQ
jgi:YD repeat-containing protein